MRRALVTGAGSADGIGFATARLLAARGVEVVITSTTARIHERAEALGVRGIVADLTSMEDAERLVREAGPVDVLVNNAGMVQTGVSAPDRLFTELTEAEWLRGIDINLHTTFRLCRLVAPGMGRGGRIVNVSSVTGPYVALLYSAAYGAAKAGVDGLTRALALELGPRGRDGQQRRAGVDRHRLVDRGGAARGREHAGRAAGHAGRGRRGDRVPGLAGRVVRDRPVDRRRRRQHAAGAEAVGAASDVRARARRPTTRSRPSSALRSSERMTHARAYSGVLPNSMCRWISRSTRSSSSIWTYQLSSSSGGMSPTGAGSCPR